MPQATVSYVLPDFLTGYLMYGDDDDIDAEDVKTVEKWRKKNKIGGCLNCTYPKTEPTFGKSPHLFTGVVCSLMEYIFVSMVVEH